MNNILSDESSMPFGKHRGKRMIDVPAQYLLWLNDDGLKDGPLKNYIERNLDALKQEASIK